MSGGRTVFFLDVDDFCFAELLMVELDADAHPVSQHTVAEAIFSHSEGAVVAVCDVEDATPDVIASIHAVSGPLLEPFLP